MAALAHAVVGGMLERIEQRSRERYEDNAADQPRPPTGAVPVDPVVLFGRARYRCPNG